MDNQINETDPIFHKDKIDEILKKQPEWRKTKTGRENLATLGQKLVEKTAETRNITAWVNIASYVEENQHALYFLKSEHLLNETFDSFLENRTELTNDDLFFFTSLLEIMESYHENGTLKYHEKIILVIEKLVNSKLEPFLYLPLLRAITNIVAELTESKQGVFANTLTILTKAVDEWELTKFTHNDIVEWKSAKEYLDSMTDSLVQQFVSNSKYQVPPLNAAEKMHFYMYIETIVEGINVKKTLVEARHSSAFLNAIQSFYMSAGSHLNGYGESGSQFLESISAGYIGLHMWGKTTRNPYVKRFIRDVISDSDWFSHKEQLRIIKAIEFMETAEYGAALFYLCSTLEGSLSRRYTIPDKVKKEPNVEALIKILKNDKDPITNSRQLTNKLLLEVNKMGDTIYMESTLSGLLTKLKKSGDKNVQVLVESAKYVLTRSSGLNIRNIAFHGRSTIYESEWGTGLLLLLVVCFSFIRYEDGRAYLVVPSRISSRIRKR